MRGSWWTLGLNVLGLQGSGRGPWLGHFQAAPSEKGCEWAGCSSLGLRVSGFGFELDGLVDIADSDAYILGPQPKMFIIAASTCISDLAKLSSKVGDPLNLEVPALAIRGRSEYSRYTLGPASR